MDFDRHSELGLTLFREAREALIVFDENDLRVLDANPTAMRLSGFCGTRLRSLRLNDVLVPEAPGLAAAPSLPAEGFRPFEGFMLMRRDGSTTPVRLRAGRVGASLGLIVANDDSDRRQAFEMIDQFFRVSPDMFCIVDSEGMFLRLNPVWEETLGHPVETLKGRRFWELIHPGDIGRTTRAFGLLSRSGELRGFENRYRHRQGHDIWLSWNAVAADDLFYAIARDVTQAKLNHVELRRSKEAAEVASEAKGRFFANVSHEIRTPMTAILALTDVLLHDPYLQNAPPGRFENLEAIKSNGEHLLEVFNDILDLEKIEQAKISIEFQRCSPAELLADAGGLLRIRADAKGLPLIIESASTCPETIRTDPVRLRQVLINLVSNAVKYTVSGEVRARVYLDRSHETPSVRFDVTDTGIGMTPEQQVHLFQPFHRANPSAASLPSGTGLGLAISRRLTDLLGATIEVDSKPGVGSTFSVIVPWDVTVEENEGIDEDSTNDQTRPTIHVDSPKSEDMNLLRRRSRPLESTASLARGGLQGTILLVEDSPTNRKAIALCLEVAGAFVSVAHDGAAAITAARAAEAEGRPFDVILMDMQMPVMDGYEATRQLRQSGYHRPIIALTAYASEDSEAGCKSIGCDAFVNKPIDWRTLIPLIQGFQKQSLVEF